MEVISITDITKKLLITILVALTLISSLNALEGNKSLIDMVHKLEAEVFSANDVDIIKSRVKSIQYFKSDKYYGLSRITTIKSVMNGKITRVRYECDIFIDTDQNADQMYVTVYHELIHALLAYENTHTWNYINTYKKYMYKFDYRYLPYLTKDIIKLTNRLK